MPPQSNLQRGLTQSLAMTEQLRRLKLRGFRALYPPLEALGGPPILATSLD